MIGLLIWWQYDSSQNSKKWEQDANQLLKRLKDGGKGLEESGKVFDKFNEEQERKIRQGFQSFQRAWGPKQLEQMAPGTTVPGGK